MRRATLLPAAALAAAALASAPPAFGGGDKVAFPDGFEKGALYTTVDRADNKQYRELFTQPSTIDAIKAGKPAPSGAVVTLVQYRAQLDTQGNPLRDANGRFVKGELIGYAVMEKRAGWGAEGAQAAPSLAAALRLAQLRLGPARRVFVIGGAQLYRDALPLADVLELTEVQADVDGDTHFPFWDRSAFDEVNRAAQPADHGVAFDFVTYRRKQPT